MMNVNMFDDQEWGIFEIYQSLLRGGYPPERARKQLIVITRNAEAVARTLEKGVEFTKLIRHENMIGRSVAVEHYLESWYPGEQSTDVHWPNLRSFLEKQENWKEAVESISKSSGLVVSLLGDPSAQTSAVRGLVVGYVQSGKTANFTATISKAADCGYRLFIVLAGVHNALRRQTQVRMQEHLKELTPGRWDFLTSELADFGTDRQLLGLLATQGRTLAVVKKNASRLEKLKDWMKQAAANGLLENCPVLIIDDEADQATVNAASKPLTQRTKIHSLITEIVGIPPRCTYVGYTATPFANVLMNAKPEDSLYPRDFIFSLPRPDGYFGSADMFGQELAEIEEEAVSFDYVRTVESDDATGVSPSGDSTDPYIPQSLWQATRWFLMASAARYARGQESHSSMLVHTSPRVEEHTKMASAFKKILLPTLRNEWSNEIERAEGWQKQWNAEIAREPAKKHGLQPIAFDQLVQHMPKIFDTVGIAEDNYRSSSRLVYGSEPRPVIAVGGNTLSRGLTLEGLVTSYFLRTAATYDALLQMGRWFGYRPGYADLVRVWTTEELWSNFRFLSLVEEDLRREIHRYMDENIRPGLLAPRIRTHPSLRVVAPNKMVFAKQTGLSFGGRHPQTTYFNHLDVDLIGGNQLAARELLTRALAQKSLLKIGSKSILKDVPVELVLEFLASYSYHESSGLDYPRLRDYVLAQNKLGALQSWNIAVFSKSGSKNKRSSEGEIDLGLGDDTQCLVRSKLVSLSSEDTAAIGTLMSRPDRVADLDGSFDGTSDAEMQRARNEHGRALLSIYPIDRESMPARTNKGGDSPRVPLHAADHLIGLGFSFPDDHPKTPRDVMSAIVLADEFLEDWDEMQNAIGGEDDGEADFESGG